MKQKIILGRDWKKQAKQKTAKEAFLLKKKNLKEKIENIKKRKKKGAKMWEKFKEYMK